MGAVSRLVTLVMAALSLLAADGCGRVNFDTAGDAGQVPTVGFELSTSLTDEAVGTHTVTIALSTPAAATVTVDVAATGGSATRGDDFALGTNRVTLLPGETTAELTIAIVDDGVEEPDETIELTLASPTGARLGLAGHKVTISANILPRLTFELGMSTGPETENGSYALVFDIAPPVDVVVAIGVSGTAGDQDHALAGGTIMIPAGTTSTTIDDAIIDDALDEDDETVAVHLTAQVGAVIGARPNHTHVITDNDPPPGVVFGMMQFTGTENVFDTGVLVKLSGPSGKTVSVDYTVTGGTAGATDFTLATGPLVFAPGTTSLALPLSPIDDAFDENDETVAIKLINPVNATLGGLDTTTWLIQDDDPLPVLSFANGSAMVDEASGTLSAQVVLSTVSGRDVQFQVTAATGTANAMDFALIGGVHTIPAGMTTAAVVVTIVDDNLDEVDESFTLALTAPVNAVVGTVGSTSITIVDNDVTASFDPVQVNGAANEGNTGTTTYQYRVKLSEASAMP